MAEQERQCIDWQDRIGNSCKGRMISSYKVRMEIDYKKRMDNGYTGSPGSDYNSERSLISMAECVVIVKL